MRLLPFCIVLCVTSACPRPADPRPEGSGGIIANTAIGNRCDQDAECRSGNCEQSVCCDVVCEGTRSCALPGTVGTCTERSTGDTCNGDGECATGFCVDGVCCNTRCDGECRTCDSPSAPGMCVDAEDNTDPRGSCGPCFSCIGLQCLPALPGSDPHRECGDGRSCNGIGVCKTAAGGACVQSADCAIGECLAGRCLRKQVSVVESAAVSSESNDQVPTAIAIDPLGRVAIALDAQRYYFDSAIEEWSYVTKSSWLMLQTASGWIPVPVAACAERYDRMAVLKLGVSTFAVHGGGDVDFLGGCADSRDGKLSGLFLSADGLVLSEELVTDVRTVLGWLGAAFDGELTVGVAYFEELRGVSFAYRALNNTGWQVRAVPGLDDNLGHGALAYLGSRPVLLTAQLASPQLRATVLSTDGTIELSDGLEFPDACTELISLRAVADHDGANPRAPILLITYVCREGNVETAPGFATFDPAAPPDQRFRFGGFVDVPIASNEDDGIENHARDAWPLMLPGGTAAFAMVTRGQNVRLINVTANGWAGADVQLSPTYPSTRWEVQDLLGAQTGDVIQLTWRLRRIAFDGDPPFLSGQTVVVTIQP